jgi:hypothetical protein
VPPDWAGRRIQLCFIANSCGYRSDGRWRFSVIVDRDNQVDRVASGERLMIRVLVFIGILAILGVIASAAFFFGGFYSVVGTAGDERRRDQTIAGGGEQPEDARSAQPWLWLRIAGERDRAAQGQAYR